MNDAKLILSELDVLALAKNIADRLPGGCSRRARDKRRELIASALSAAIQAERNRAAAFERTLSYYLTKWREAEQELAGEKAALKAKMAISENLEESA